MNARRRLYTIITRPWAGTYFGRHHYGQLVLTANFLNLLFFCLSTRPFHANHFTKGSCNCWPKRVSFYEKFYTRARLHVHQRTCLFVVFFSYVLAGWMNCSGETLCFERQLAPFIGASYTHVKFTFTLPGPNPNDKILFNRCMTQRPRVKKTNHLQEHREASGEFI